MVTSMLERAIEIEGLLRIIRDGDPLPETYILLNTKAAELAEQAVFLAKRAATPEPKAAQADFVMESPKTPAPSMPEVTFTVQEQRSMQKKLVESEKGRPDMAEEDTATTADDLSLIEEDDILLTFDDPGEYSIPTSTTPAKEESMAPEEETDIAPQAFEAEDAPEEETEIKEAELTFTEGPTDDIEELPATEKHQEVSLPTDTAKLTKQPKNQIKLKSAFSLNDRFLYGRELFEGNMKMFDSTLEFIEGIEDYSIIEDYFYSELEWDPEDSNVAAFMDILRPHFKE